jgi:hypothetical protein
LTYIQEFFRVFKTEGYKSDAHKDICQLLFSVEDVKYVELGLLPSSKKRNALDIFEPND